MNDCLTWGDKDYLTSSVEKWTKVDIRLASSWPGHVKIHVAYLEIDKKKIKVRNVC